MKNLKLIKSVTKTFENAPNRRVLSFASDTKPNVLYVLYEDGAVSKLDVNEPTEDVFHLAEKPIKIWFLPVTCEISVCSESKLEIFNYDLELTATYEVPEGIRALEWSPDQDTFSLLTNDNNVRVVTVDSQSQFYASNKDVNLNEFKFYNQFVNVGWGKKETQFHGSVGKNARKQVEIVDPDSIEIIDAKSTITWRGSGDLFAVNFKRGDSYAFLVVDKNGTPKNASELCPGLESALAWRPCGNLIAGVQRVNGRRQVVFFEKNGLRHREFDLDDDDDDEIMLSWSPDSDILTIFRNGRIQLYTSSNYHWYLKQSFRVETNASIIWNEDVDIKHEKMMMILADGQFSELQWTWNVCYSRDLSANNEAFVAVIDKSRVLMTNFKRVIVPPPMSAMEIPLENCNFLTFSIENNDLCCVNDAYVVTIWTYANGYSKSCEIKLSDILPSGFDTRPLSVNHFTFKTNQICFVYNDEIFNVNVENQASLSGKINENVVYFEQVPGRRTKFIAQFHNGSLSLLNDMFSEEMKLSVMNLVVKCEIIHVDNQLIAFVLDKYNRFHLYLNGGMTQVATDVTSMFLHSHFLLLTNTQHKLLCVDVTSIDAIKSITHSNAMFERNIERNAHIITAVHHDKRVILQMPRGNLEAINPRALTIRIVSRLIDSLEYRKAFTIMKTERINMNLLYDHNPGLFEGNVKKFIDELETCDNLNLFLLELIDEDITQTMYRNCYGERDRQNIAGKIVRITSRMLTALNDSKHLLTIITCHMIKRNRDGYENALMAVKRANVDGEKPNVIFDKALAYLLLLTNINQLYDIALGMYDFDLITHIAFKSQKDPKEYIPFLNDLKNMDEDYRKFTINKYLKRWDEALVCLARCDVRERAKEINLFVAEHQLYREALRLFKDDHEVHQQLCQKYGEFLSRKKCHKEAAMMFERAKNIPDALNEYKKALDWIKCLDLLKILHQDDEYKKQCTKFAGEIMHNHDLYRQAGVIFLDHVDDYERAINAFVQGKCWDDVLRIIRLHGRCDLIETHLSPGVRHHGNALKQQIHINREEFEKNHERLSLVRRNMKTVTIGGEIDTANDMDLISETSSVASFSTGASKSSQSSSASFRSFRSSKNRRKHERKKYNMKEGSQFEDIALIKSLHQLYVSTYALREECHTVTTHMLHLNMDEDAKQIQMDLDCLIKQMERKKMDVWTRDVVNNLKRKDEKIDSTTGGSTSNSAANTFMKDNLNDLECRYDLLDDDVRVVPKFNDVHWKYHCLDG